MKYLRVERVNDRQYPIVFCYYHKGTLEGPKSFWHSDRKSLNLTLGLIARYLKNIGKLPLDTKDYVVKELLRDEEAMVRQTLASPWESIQEELKSGIVQKVQEAYDKMTTRVLRKRNK